MCSADSVRAERDKGLEMASRFRQKYFWGRNSFHQLAATRPRQPNNPLDRRHSPDILTRQGGSCDCAGRVRLRCAAGEARAEGTHSHASSPANFEVSPLERNYWKTVKCDTLLRHQSFGCTESINPQCFHTECIQCESTSETWSLIDHRCVQWILTGGKLAISGFGPEFPLDQVLGSHCKNVVNSNTDYG